MMIVRLTGLVDDVGLDGVLLDVQGVGYQVMVSTRTRAALPARGEAAVEETFVNVNPVSTLKLGQARGVVLLAPARAGLPVFEYSTNLVKKSVTGAGHADKRQIAMMVGRLLPGVDATNDAADALAVAICHAHHRATHRALAKRVEAAL